MQGEKASCFFIFNNYSIEFFKMLWYNKTINLKEGMPVFINFKCFKIYLFKLADKNYGRKYKNIKKG